MDSGVVLIIVGKVRNSTSKIISSITCPGWRQFIGAFLSFIRADAIRPGNTEILRIAHIENVDGETLVTTLFLISQLKLFGYYQLKRPPKKPQGRPNLEPLNRVAISIHIQRVNRP